MPTQTRRVFIPLATLILLVAAFLRLWMLHMYPPGPHYDEAVYLLVSRTVAFGGARPFPILEAYQGREVLYFYLNWLPLTLIHNGIFTLHMVNALCGIVITAASMTLGRLMFSGWRGVIIGLAMGAAAAISFPQMWLARQAFRAITLPLMQSLALIALWRGLRGERRYLTLMIAGVLAGGAVYTYNSSRLFPLWLALAALVLLIADRERWRTRVRQGIAFFVPLMLTALPMAIYAVQRPDIFFNRLGEVTQADQSISLWESALLHLRMFFIEGDPYLRYNLPGRPYFTLFEGLLLIIGIGAAAWGVFRARRPIEKAAYALALLSPLMVIPSVISVGGLPPSHMRSLGMIPLVFVLIGVGYERVWAWVRKSLTPRPRLQSIGDGEKPRRGALFALPIIVLFALLSIGAVRVGGEYFAWAGRADVYYESDADLAAAGDWVREQRQVDEIVYVAARDRGHPTFMIAEIPDVTWLGTDSLFLPPPDRAGLLIFPRSAPPPVEWAAWLEAGRITDIPIAPDGRTAFEAFRIGAELPLPEVQTPPVVVRNAALTLIGMRTATGGAGEIVPVDMVWRINAPAPASDFTPIVQLEDANGFVLSRTMPYVTETDRWRAGEVYIQRVAVEIPAGTPPGEYPIRVGWVGRAADRYYTYVNPDGSTGGLWAAVGTLDVIRPLATPELSTFPIDIRVDAPMGDGVELLGWSTLPDERRPGESIPLTVYWHAVDVQGAARPATWRVDLGSQTLFEGMFDAPTDRWQTGDVYAQRVLLPIPRDQATGALPLTLHIGDTSLNMGEIDVVGSARLFEIPPFDVPLTVTFGDSIRMVGYSLENDDNGLHVQFVWQTMREMEQDYTLFVHVLDENGEIVAQYDAMPLANTYPTSLWAAGEVVVDVVGFAFTGAARSLRWGWYVQATGERLPVSGDFERGQGDSVSIILDNY